MKEELVYFKQELFSMPKEREAEFRLKYGQYQEKVAHDYETQLKRLERTVKGDEVGLLRLDQETGGDQQNNKGKAGGLYESQVVKQGFET